MACINPDGTLTPVAAQVLRALSAATGAGTVEAIVGDAQLPAYRVRASLRELRDGGLVSEEGGIHHLTAAGHARLEAAAVPGGVVP